MSSGLAGKPPPPVRPTVPADHPSYDLWHRTREALTSLPSYFATEIVISGLRATDIFTLHSTLGATIEDQVVDTLNRMRPVWDSENRFALFSFIRQPQTFPDVLLAKRSPNHTGVDEIAFGIELKGWYLLAKEGEPSFRYLATPEASTDLDMIVIIPWYLSNVISGTPRVLEPYIESAKFAALYRNYHWMFVRETAAHRGITSPSNVSPYPKKTDRIADEPDSDAGSNFGRIARTGIMDDYMAEMEAQPIAGIAARYWRQFFRMFQENDDPARISDALQRMEDHVVRSSGPGDEGALAQELLAALREVFGKMGPRSAV